MARSRSKHQRKRMKIRQAWKKRRNNQKKAAAKTTASKPSAAKAPAA
ncbi:MAG: aminopeptidase [Myxococcaceae bacterium]